MKIDKLCISKENELSNKKYINQFYNQFFLKVFSFDSL